MTEEDYVIDLLKGATNSNLLDHYNLAKSKVTKYKNIIKRHRQSAEKQQSKVLKTIHSLNIHDYQKDLNLAQKEKDAILGLLLSAYNKHCEINKIPFRASNLTDIKKANVDIKIVVVKRNAE